MKRAISYVLGISVLGILSSGCGKNTEFAATDSTPEPKTTAEAVAEATPEQTAIPTQTVTREAENTLISEEEAKKIVLEDAGANEQEISGIRIKLDMDDGIQEYEIKFYADNKEYEYEVDAVSGQIRSMDIDIDEDSPDIPLPENGVTEEQAKEAVLAKVPGATEKDMRIHLDYDDGKVIYEGSILYNGAEYEFEMDAQSGVIFEWKEER